MNQSMKKRRTYKIDIENARDQLKSRLEELDSSSFLSVVACKPVVVCDFITREEFRCWLGSHEGELHRWHFYPAMEDVGRVVLYNLPTPVHDRTAAWIVQQIVDQVVAIGDGDPELMHSLVIEGRAVSDIGDRDQAPDQSLAPLNASMSAPPNLVVEIAHTNESWPLLKQRLEHWMGHKTTVQVAIGVFICGYTQRRVTLLQRGQLAQTAEFNFGALPKSITFPVGALYYGVAIPSALHGQEQVDIAIETTELRAAVAAALPSRRSR